MYLAEDFSLTSTSLSVSGVKKLGYHTDFYEADSDRTAKKEQIFLRADVIFLHQIYIFIKDKNVENVFVSKFCEFENETIYYIKTPFSIWKCI